MRIRLMVFIAFMVLLETGCYRPINGQVVDAETNQPIEGAVVLVEWTKTKGYGFTYTESYKVAETLTDKDGKFNLPGCYSPFVNEPDVTVYKKGYVAWNSKLIFPGYVKRENYRWQNSFVYKMKKFKPDYFFDDHMSFIRGIVLSGTLNKKKQIMESLKWEEEKAFEERRLRK